jgi:glutaminase
MKPDRAIWLPMQRYLEDLHAKLCAISDGELASYIPELTLADPNWFGIALVTVDGSVYQVGDARQEFTVQSISKAITYGVALEDQGIEGVFAKVGVEPSGEAFNSISLEPDSGRPFNPMINAGAIATTGLIEGRTREVRLARILARFEKYVGRPVTVDEQVYRSERDTGHRNRAISHLLRNADILTGDPEDALDVYFKQRSTRVTARDLALMGACLANNGVSSITGVVALNPKYVDKVLSVMSTCGMYDYSGNWVFSVGMPAKSGVGGGTMAVLPGQFGLGVFSPRLDAKGNSFRGIKVCEAVSRDFALHTFKVAKATSSSVVRVAYHASAVHSKRLRNSEERQLLAGEGTEIRVYELQGELMFGSTDSVIRTISNDLETATHVILDFRRVVEIDTASAKLLAGLYASVEREGKRLLFTGAEDKYSFRRHLSKQAVGVDTASLRRFSDTDRVLEWCEDQLIGRRRGSDGGSEVVPLAEQYLCQGLSAGELDQLCHACRPRTFAAGEMIFSAGDPADAFFFILSGAVEILIRLDGKRERRRVTMSPGMSFGEFALVTEGPRSAHARAVTESRCQEIRFTDIDEAIKVKLLVNLARELSRRLTREASELRILG